MMDIAVGEDEGDVDPVVRGDIDVTVVDDGT